MLAGVSFCEALSQKYLRSTPMFSLFQKKLVLLFLVLFFQSPFAQSDTLPKLSAVSTNACDKKNGALQISVVLDKTIAAAHEPVGVTIMVANTGRDTLHLPAFMELESYWLRFEVLNEKNQRVRWLGPEMKILETDDKVSLEQGYQWGRKFRDFERRYAVSKAGMYRIRAIYGISPEGRCPFGRVVSEVVSLRIR
ncbi:Uncharacterised protein [Janthinobacterium lividum]|nr:hypothetical protein JANLI_38490 [Janthinobacterium lividum]STQ94546.1 Uncharacterised protein [Janthinobacterium lividum]